MHNEIRSYCEYFGLPHVYITLNPNAAHSPIFQAMFGDETVGLTKRFPVLVSAWERAIRSAKDPVLQVIDEDEDVDDWENIYTETGKRSRSSDGPASTEPSPKRAACADDELQFCSGCIASL